MSRFIPTNRTKNEAVENVLATSALARSKKEQDASVINATIGSYYDEYNHFLVYDAVKNYFKETNPSSFLTYSSILGPIKFTKSVIEWVFNKHLDVFSNQFAISLCPTPGGTGALYLAFINYLEKGDLVLLPNFRWPTYVQIATSLDIPTKDYRLFNEENEFDIKDIEEKIKNEIGKTKRICLLINDPCHNPTGFVMQKKDYAALVDLVNKYAKKITITILMDIAYLDYSIDAGIKTREHFLEFLNLTDDAQLLFAFSASKTFGIYGLRTGALIHLTRLEEEKQAFLKVASYTARSTWSNVSNLGMNIVSDILSSNETKLSFKQELEENAKNLKERADELIKILKAENVPFAPYTSGFFVTILFYTQEFESFLRENKLYGCKMENTTRIAISGITKEEAKKAGKIINEGYQKYYNKK